MSTETSTYDGDGVRFSRQVGAGPVIRAVTDPTAGLPVTIDDGTRKYVWGLGLAYAVSGTSIEVQHTDRLGSIRAVTNGTGAVIATFRTDEFGIPTASTGSAGSPFRYTGEPLDASGLTYLRARHYDASIGRFMTRDPFSGVGAAPVSLNRYSYVGNNPTTLSDPSGLCVDPGGPGLRYCIERFIPTQSVLYLDFGGDNRTYQNDGGTYRFQSLIFHQADGSWAVRNDAGVSVAFGVLSSKGVLENCDVGFSKSKILDSTVFGLVGCEAKSTLIPTPSIVTTVLIQQTSEGASVVAANGTTYPSMEVWQYGGADGPTLLFGYDASVGHGTHISELWAGGSWNLMNLPAPYVSGGR